MDFRVEEPPLNMRKQKKKMRKKRKKMTNPTSSPSPSLSSLPDEMVVNCLARVSKSQYSSLCLVSKSFYSLLSSPDIYAVRSELGVTESRLYVCIRSPNDRRWFTLGEVNNGELSLVPVKFSSFRSPGRLTTTTLAAGSEIYQIGGALTENRSKSRSKTVLVFDLRSNTLRWGPNLIVARKHAKSCFLDGKIYVIGGCSKADEKPMNWGEVLDIKTQTWKPLPSPSEIYMFDRNDGVGVFGGRLHVFTKNNNYAYDPKEGRWVVPEVDFVGLGPISCLREPWCVIDNVMFTHDQGYLKWYNPKNGMWYIVDGWHDLFAWGANRNTFQLVNHGGKLFIIWNERNNFIKYGSKYNRICCAVIRLQKHRCTNLLNYFKLRGKVERCNVLLPVLPLSHKLSRCLSLSV